MLQKQLAPYPPPSLAQSGCHRRALICPHLERYPTNQCAPRSRLPPGCYGHAKCLGIVLAYGTGPEIRCIGLTVGDVLWLMCAIFEKHVREAQKLPLVEALYRLKNLGVRMISWSRSSSIRECGVAH